MACPSSDLDYAPGAAPSIEQLTAAVLCGGRSSRFGADKARQRIGGSTLLERVWQSLAPAQERLLVGRPYALPGARQVPDQRPGLGPLAGLEAALAAAGGAWVALAACDLPCLTQAYWRLLCRRATDRDAVVVRWENGRLEPLAALYHRRVLPRVRASLDAGSLSLHALLRSLDTVELDRRQVEAVCGPAVLRNVNRPEDLAADDPCAP